MISFFILFKLLCFLYFPSVEPVVKVTGKVIGTNENPLQNATIVIMGENRKGTITNDKGFFEIEILSLPCTIKISHLGFKTKEIQFNNEDYQQIQLEEEIIETGEVEIFPIHYLERIVQNAFRKGNSLSEIKYNSLIYYKQIAEKNHHSQSIIEAFYNGSVSYIGILGSEIIHGRMAKNNLNSVNEPTNQFILNSSFHFIKPEKGRNHSGASYLNNFNVPIAQNFKSNYTPYFKGTIKGEAEEILILTLKPKTDNSSLPTSEIYIGKQTYKVYKYKGTYSIGQSFINFEMEYKPYQNNMLPLFIHTTFHAPQSGIKISSLILFHQISRMKIDFSKNSWWLADLHDIHKTNYNPEFWRNNPIIARTPLEEEVIAEFERTGAFGNLLPSANGGGNQ